MEVKLWMDRGWFIIPSERNGVVLMGKKQMRIRDKVFLVLGAIGLVFFAVGLPLIGAAGGLLIALAGLDYWRNTPPPTKFFPAHGDQSRTMERG